MSYFTEERINEWLKCRDNPEYFIEKYIRVINNNWYEPIKLNQDQRYVIKDFSERRNVERLMSRSAGKTTVALALILHAIVFSHDKTIGLVGHKLDHAKEMLRSLYGMLEELPEWMRVKFTKCNKDIAVFENGMVVVASGVYSDRLRGMAINILYIDEFMYFERNDWRWFVEHYFPVFKSGTTTKTLMLSTW